MHTKLIANLALMVVATVISIVTHQQSIVADSVELSDKWETITSTIVGMNVVFTIMFIRRAYLVEVARLKGEL